MTTTWISEDGEPVDKKISIIGWFLVMVRGALIILVITTGLVFKLFFRVFEKPMFRNRRPLTPYITIFVSKI